MQKTLTLRLLSPCLLVLWLMLYSLTALAESFDRALGISLPDQMAGLSLSGKHEYPQPELGVSYNYNRTGEITVTLYVYNNGWEEIPANIEDQRIHKHFRQVIADVSKVANNFDISADIAAEKERTSTFDGCGPQFIFKSFELETPRAVLSSLAYLTVHNNHFVKLRISYIRGDDKSAANAQEFIQALRQLLGSCKKNDS